MTDTVLSVQSLGYRTAQRWLLKDVSFALGPGFTAMVGPNGAGKSTLMRTISGLLPAMGGSLTVENSESGDATRKIGYIPQFPGTYDNLTPRQFLLRTGWWDNPRQLSDLQLKVDGVLDRMDLNSVASTPGRALHVSVRRRVALASVWMRNVAVVLLDEPTAGLDPEERLAFWQELYRLRHLADGPRAYLITTHLLAEVDRYCESMVLLDHGRTRYSGPVSGFIDSARGHAFLAPELPSGFAGVETGRFSRQGHWIVAAAAAESWYPRQPDIVDAYLWAIHGSELRGGKP